MERLLKLAIVISIWKPLDERTTQAKEEVKQRTCLLNWVRKRQ